MKVLYNTIIVEDDLMVSAILQKQLSRFSQLSLVNTFRRGTDALDFLQETPDAAELIILDYYMPNMSGIEFLSKLRETNKYIHVIMITSADEYSVIRSAMCSGICDYILKPFSSARLEKAINRFEAVMRLTRQPNVWTQDRVDALLNPHRHYSPELNSGDDYKSKAAKINPTTLAGIREYLKGVAGVKMPLPEISRGVGLSTVTVRRYMKHLASLGEVSITLDNKTGGRPSEIIEYTGTEEI
ncbi:MAG: response regulator [Oscillospiraceae bacterium]|nr:response regulator [Oscillospiraceae bacterium]